MLSIQSKEIGSPIEIRLQTATGWRLMELVGAPVSWFQEGSIILSFRDLTERRRYELSPGHESRFSERWFKNALVCHDAGDTKRTCGVLLRSAHSNARTRSRVCRRPPVNRSRGPRRIAKRYRRLSSEHPEGADSTNPVIVRPVSCDVAATPSFHLS